MQLIFIIKILKVECFFKTFNQIKGKKDNIYRELKVIIVFFLFI